MAAYNRASATRSGSKEGQSPRLPATSNPAKWLPRRLLAGFDIYRVALITLCSRRLS